MIILLCLNLNYLIVELELEPELNIFNKLTNIHIFLRVITFSFLKVWTNDTSPQT